MRTIRILIAAAFLASAGFSYCLSQPPGPATLENLLEADGPQGSPADAKSEVSIEGTNRPAGTATRPSDGVQHPDLDRAWDDYDSEIVKAAEDIRAVVTKHFDAAAGKGDLDAADKWQTILDRFEKTGEIPAEPETKGAVNSAVACFKKAKEELSKAYESVVKTLTIEKKIAEAKAVREELQSLSNATTVAADRKKQPSGDVTPQPPIKRGELIADYICTVTDDFVVDVFFNGDIVPADKRKLLGEVFGAQIERIDAPIHKGDWVVFAVANNRLRWGGSYFFGVAGISKEKILGFQSKLGDPRWTYTDDPGSVMQLIRQKNVRGRPVERVKVVWGDGQRLMKQHTGNLWSGDPIWGTARLSWIKFNAD